MQLAFQSAPLSEVFETLKTISGQNRVVIDTESSPWRSLCKRQSLDREIFEIISNANTTILLKDFRRKFLPGTSEEEFFQSGSMLMNAYFVVKKLDAIHADVVKDDDSIDRLWEKVKQVESVLYEFLHFQVFCEKYIFTLGKDTLMPNKLFELFAFVKAHTKGRMHTSAARGVFEIGMLNTVDPPRRWKCAICYEGVRKSHLCFENQCGHVFHISCDLSLKSPECPLCRSIDDL